MSDNGLCRLCQDNLAVKVDAKEPLVESASRTLIQRLFECYQIDVSILKNRSSICKQCYEGVLQIRQCLEKWSKAQEVLKATPLDIDDSKVFQIKLEPNSEPTFPEIQEEPPVRSDNVIFIKEEEPQTEEDVEFIEDEDLELIEKTSTDDSNVDMLISEDSDDDAEVSANAANSDWRSSLQNFFCICLGPDGLALTILFKDKTKERSIRMLCTCCNQLFSTMSDVHKHASEPRAHPEYWCGVCDAIYPSIFELKVHEKIKKHSRPKTRAMVMRCLKCGTRTRQLGDAIRHENETHDKSSHVCNKCRVSFTCRDSFDKHLKHQIYVCRYPNCFNRYRLWPNYTKHLAWHKNHRSPCPIEGCRVIMDPRSHDQHLRTHLITQQRGKIERVSLQTKTGES